MFKANEPGPPGGSFFAQFLWGAGFLLRGLRMLARSRRLVTLSLVPFLVSLGVYLVAAALLVAFGGKILDLVIEPGAWWRAILRVLMTITMSVVFLLAFVFTYSAFSFVIAAPFYDFLSAAAERVGTGEVVEAPAGWKEMLVDLWRSITEAVKFLLIEIVLWVFGLFCFPPISTVICFALSAAVIGLEHMGSPMGRRRMTFRDKIRFARRHFWPVVGLGTVGTLALLVPFVGVAFLPIGVIGGTVMFCELSSGDGAA